MSGIRPLFAIVTLAFETIYLTVAAMLVDETTYIPLGVVATLVLVVAGSAFALGKREQKALDRIEHLEKTVKCMEEKIIREIKNGTAVVGENEPKS